MHLLISAALSLAAATTVLLSIRKQGWAQFWLGLDDGQNYERACGWQPAGAASGPADAQKRSETRDVQEYGERELEPLAA
jgi:hypothetical protein